MMPPPEDFSLSTPAAPTQQPLDLPKPAAPQTPKTERRKKDSVRLVWDSKPKRPPSPRDIEFQTAEIVIPNPARDEATLPYTTPSNLLAGTDIDRSKMNRLIWGDNILAMQALLSQGYESKIDLIYIDPPYDSKADYSHRMTLANQKVTKQPSAIERLAYSDMWEGGTDSYLDMLYPRLQLMKRLLSETGNIFVHMDWHVGHYVRVMLDEVFGRGCFRNEIIWYYYNKMHDSRKGLFPRASDTLYWYSKRPGYGSTFNLQEEDREEAVEQLVREKVDGVLVNARDDDGNLIYQTKTTRTVDNIWKVPLIPPADVVQTTGFATQKPERVLELVINSASNPGDLVADFFGGSGTTAAVAEKLGRRWITSDLGKVGVQVTRARLVQQDAKPFLIENIGSYQREMIYLTGGRIFEMQKIILKLYGATPHPNHPDLGTRTDKSGPELVYVGYPDRPTTAKKAEELAALATTLDGNGYKRLVILAWDYDYNFTADWEYRSTPSQRQARPKVDVQFRTIPPDIYDYLKKAKSEDDIYKLAASVQFHEKPYLKIAKPKLAKPDKESNVEVTIAIDKYVLFDLPVDQDEQPKLREAIKDNFALLIDYWAVDWTHDNRTFRSQWQAIRGNGKRATIVPITATHTYSKLDMKENPTIAIRVVDVFGNDATATLTL